MVEIHMPSGENLTLDSAVFDYNGTLACDGHLEEGVADRLLLLANDLKVYILTADTFGIARAECAGLPVTLKVVSQTNGTDDKRRFVLDLGADRVACVGNGVNDGSMMDECALSIAVIGREGCSVRTLISAHIVVNNAIDAIDLLLNPKRLVATLRR